MGTMKSLPLDSEQLCFNHVHLLLFTDSGREWDVRSVRCVWTLQDVIL